MKQKLLLFLIILLFSTSLLTAQNSNKNNVSDQRILEMIETINRSMVSIPGGTFRMGDLNDRGNDNEKPTHIVTLKPFRLNKFEVTFDQWDACANDRGCSGYLPDDEGKGRGNRPVRNVSWFLVQGFIKWLNSKSGSNYRLPTEAEWEYAARAGSTTLYSWGNGFPHDQANCSSIKWHESEETCDDSYENTAPVGSFPANAWGLHEMHGNVGEWVQDCWHNNYQDAPVDGKAWNENCQRYAPIDEIHKELGDDPIQYGFRVTRGGGWTSDPNDIRSAFRIPQKANRGDAFSIGFRLAQDDLIQRRKEANSPKDLQAELEIIKTIEEQMVLIPGGSFYMGRKTKGYNEVYETMRPRHKVTIKAFKIGKYEVTFAEWKACVKDGGCAAHWPGDELYKPGEDEWEQSNRPVIDVSWYHAQAFIAWLNKKTNKNYRLPTEAEWEYAARAGSTTEFPWGNKYRKSRMNCNRYWKKGDWVLCDEYRYTAPVGSFPANAWGLHDMLGNVEEWIQDCWHKNYEYAPINGSAWNTHCDQTGGMEFPDTNERVIRGGSWNSLAVPTSDYRSYRSAFAGGYDKGFRLAHDN